MMRDGIQSKKHWIVLGTVCLLYMATFGLAANTMGVYYAHVADDLNILRGTFAMNVTVSSILQL